MRCGLLGRGRCFESLCSGGDELFCMARRSYFGGEGREGGLSERLMVVQATLFIICWSFG